MSKEYQMAQHRCFPGVDYVKFFMALCVVAIHVNSSSCVISHWPDAVEWLIRLAVPFFFICSGFFLGRKINDCTAIEDKRKTIFKRATKIGRIFTCWLLIYLPITLYIDVNNGSTLAHDVVTYFGRLFLSGESECAYPLWFLYSMAIVLTIYALSFKIRCADMLLLASFALVTGINTFISSGFVGDDTVYTKWFYLLTSRTLGGGLYIMSGILLSRIDHLPKYWISYILITVSILLFVFKLPYWELCGGVALFVLALRLKKAFGAGSSLRWRSMSMWVYYIHMYVIFTLALCFTQKEIVFTPMKFMVIVSGVVVVLAGILTKLQNVKGFKWLNFLVN